MNIGAPLWFIELSNKASLDEIKHTKISFDIANMLIQQLNNKNNQNIQCIVADKFPAHKINIST